jgi:hypothetical protein
VRNFDISTDPEGIALNDTSSFGEQILFARSRADRRINNRSKRVRERISIPIPKSILAVEQALDFTVIVVEWNGGDEV